MSNRLADETSPYLRQHRDNPVDWYPWGDEAFAEARASDRPVLLSVGYSACHWCHVMAHESFEDDDTAALMNRLFVNVKVDREERPDVDAVYMDAVQALSGHGGWPMTVFLTPDGEPFFGGTYYPKVARQGMPSFTDVCRAVDEHWRNQRAEVTEQAGRLVDAVSRAGRLEPGEGPPSVAVVDAAVDQLVAQHDDEWGGFGRAPKFPQSMSLDLLLAARSRSADADGDALDRVLATSLGAMASGGMYDHLGGGFARYSVDAYWLVPHFEKMLYDQALLARTYTRAGVLADDPVLRQVAAETVDYVLRDLRHPAGGFTSAEDADSEGVEGAFYVWRRPEIDEVLGDDAGVAVEWYGVTDAGNFEGANILHRPVRGDLLRPPPVEAARARLFEARERRERPGLDDKVLTEWNGLMIATLARTAGPLGRADHLDAARAAADFLLTRLRRDDGRWLRSWQGESDAEAEGRARHLAYAGDYAAVVDGLTRLAEASGEARWLTEARIAADALLELFWDEDRGGLFTTGHDAPALVARQKDFLDNATPSANSAAATALLRLGALTGEDRFRDRAADILTLFGPLAEGHPTAFAHLLGAVDLYQRGITEVVVTGDRPDLVEAVWRSPRPDLVVAWGEPYESPLWEGRADGQAYVCRNYACRLPATSPEELEEQLG